MNCELSYSHYKFDDEGYYFKQEYRSKYENFNCEELETNIKNKMNHAEKFPLVVIKICGVKPENINSIKLDKVAYSEVTGGILARIERDAHHMILILSHQTNKSLLEKWEGYAKEAAEPLYEYYRLFPEGKTDKLFKKFKEISRDVKNAISVEDIAQLQENLLSCELKMLYVAEILEKSKLIEYYIKDTEQKATPYSFFCSFLYDIKTKGLETLQRSAQLASENVLRGIELQSQKLDELHQEIAEKNRERLDGLLLVVEIILGIEAISILFEATNKYMEMNVVTAPYSYILTLSLIFIGLITIDMVVRRNLKKKKLFTISNSFVKNKIISNRHNFEST